MNILIFEYITGGGMAGQDLPSSLLQEGEMMFASIVSDFESLPDVKVTSLRDYRLSSTTRSGREIVIGPNDSCVEEIERVIEQLDALLIIAPETNGVLASLCRKFSNRDFILLNSSINAIQLATNKLAIYKFLQKHDVAQIPTYSSNELENLRTEKLVMKPIDGAGCEQLYLLDSKTDISEIVEKHRAQDFIIQPFIEGEHASLSLMCWDGKCIILSCNKQNLVEENGGFKLRGCDVNAFNPDEFKKFSKIIVKALPELRGYIGVDILITDDEVLLVEVNPRLTTSYVGINQAIGVNPAELMLHCFTHNKLPKLKAIHDNKITIDLENSCAA